MTSTACAPMTFQNLLYEPRGAVAWITLNRPSERNAVSPVLLEELLQAVSAAEADPAIRAVVLTGSGAAFCAGADLKALQAALEPTEGRPDFSARTQLFLARLRNLPKPVIAAINGLAIAGGLELAMCCDVLIASQSAKLGDGHANFGVFPGGGGAAVLPRMIGLNRAKQLLFTGELVDAAQMLAWGFLNEVVPDAELTERAAALAERMAGKSALVLRRMKEVANQSLDQSLDAALSHEMLECRQHTLSHDFREGLAAFRERRTPVFIGA